MAALDNNANVQPISGQNGGQRRKLNPFIMPITLQQSRASSGVAAGGSQIGIPPVSILIPPQTVSTLDLSVGSWFVSVIDAGSYPGTIHPDIQVYGLVSESGVTTTFQKLRLNPPIAPWTVTNTRQVLLSSGKTRLHLAHESRSALMFVVRAA
jgi:hypothetical protein